MKGKQLAALAISLCAVVAGCSDDDSDDAASATPEDTSATAPSDTASDQALDPDATIRIISTAPPPGSWDPASPGNPTQNIAYYSYVYDTLLRLNAENELEPRLATEWAYDDTQTVLTLTLRDDVTFTDGSQFTAEVAKLNLDRVRNGTGGAAQLLAGIESIEVGSPTELVITQTTPSARLLFALASTAASMASPLAIEDPQALAQNPVGSGPYVLETVDPTSATFDRNDDHWDTDVVYAARHVMTGAADTTARMNAILGGSADFVQVSQTAPSPDVVTRVDNGTLQMLVVPGQPATIGINNTVAPLDNSEVMLAINHAIDRQTYSDVVYEGLCEPLSQPFVEGQVGHVEGLEYEYDLDRARELMDEAGVGEVTVKFQSVAGTSTVPVELVQSMLAEIGITLEVTLSPVQEVLPNFFSGEFGMSVLRVFVAAPDPSYTTDYITGPQNPGTKDPALVEMVDAANTLSVDDPARAEAYEEITRYVFENPVMIPLCQNPSLLIANPDVVGIDSIPFTAVGGLDATRLGMRAE